MASDGKQLEALVAYVERSLLPPGFDVRTNERVLNDEGVQIAEFDIEVRGKIGTTEIAWLIECRDRPGSGPAPGAWIEQLVGRRMRFGFNKVTAVSTTGFARGAADFANAQGIEIREVKSLDPSEFSDWLALTSMQQIRRVTDLKHAQINLDPAETTQAKLAALEAIKGAGGNDPILRSTSSGVHVNAQQAFFGVIQENEGAFEGVEPGTPRQVQVVANYPDEDHYVIATHEGDVHVKQIVFVGELRVEEIVVPIDRTVEYVRSDGGSVISQVASFAPQDLLGTKIVLEFHRMSETGETHVVARRAPEV